MSKIKSGYMVNSKELKRSGINRKIPQISEEEDGRGERDSAISLCKNDNGGDLELALGDLRETEIDMEIDNRYEVLEEPEIGESAISNLSGVGFQRHPLITTCIFYGK